MMGVFAEFERAIVQERVRAGLKRSKSEGKQLATSRRKIGVLRRGNQQCDATQIAPG